MRILLVTPYFPPEVGSAAHLYAELGGALRDRGHEVMVLTGLPRYHVLQPQEKGRRRPLAWQDYRGLKVLRVFNLDIPWDLPWLRGVDQLCSALSALAGGALLPSFDVALAYSPPLPLALAAWALSRARGRPLVLNVQDLFPQSPIDLGVLKNPGLIRFFRGMESFLYRHADLIVVHSEGNASYIAARGGAGEKVRVIPNWVDTGTLRPGRRQNGLRAELGLERYFLVTFAGIMGYSQDLDTVVQAAARLKGREDIAFLLVGDGVEKGRLVQMAREQDLSRVFFLPLQPKERYGEVLTASDVCLATLRPEVGTPVVPSKILGIMAAARPVLAGMPLAGDAPRLVKEAGCGLCVPSGDPEALAQAILHLYAHPRLRGRMGARGRRYAVGHLSLNACAGRWESVMGGVIPPN